MTSGKHYEIPVFQKEDGHYAFAAAFSGAGWNDPYDVDAGKRTRKDRDNENGNGKVDQPSAKRPSAGRPAVIPPPVGNRPRPATRTAPQPTPPAAPAEPKVEAAADEPMEEEVATEPMKPKYKLRAPVQEQHDPVQNAQVAIAKALEEQVVEVSLGDYIANYPNTLSMATDQLKKRKIQVQGPAARPKGNHAAQATMRALSLPPIPVTSSEPHQATTIQTQGTSKFTKNPLFAAGLGFLNIRIGKNRNICTRAMIDSGAEVNLISRKVASLLKDEDYYPSLDNKRLKAVNTKSNDTIGVFKNLQLTSDKGMTVEQHLYIQDPMDFPIILGQPFLQATGAVVTYLDGDTFIYLHLDGKVTMDRIVDKANAKAVFAREGEDVLTKSIGADSLGQEGDSVEKEPDRLSINAGTFGSPLEVGSPFY